MNVCNVQAKSVPAENPLDPISATYGSDALMQVFKHLPQSDLRNASQVCRSWRALMPQVCDVKVAETREQLRKMGIKDESLLLLSGRLGIDVPCMVLELFADEDPEIVADRIRKHIIDSLRECEFPNIPEELVIESLSNPKLLETLLNTALLKSVDETLASSAGSSFHNLVLCMDQDFANVRKNVLNIHAVISKQIRQDPIDLQDIIEKGTKVLQLLNQLYTEVKKHLGYLKGRTVSFGTGNAFMRLPPLEFLQMVQPARLKQRVTFQINNDGTTSKITLTNAIMALQKILSVCTELTHLTIYSPFIHRTVFSLVPIEKLQIIAINDSDSQQKLPRRLLALPSLKVVQFDSKAVFKTV